MLPKLVPTQPWKVHDLPPPDTTRWVASRKRKVLQALKDGLVGDEYIIQLYALSVEELELWKASLEKRGLDGLKVTKIKQGR